MMKHIDLKSWSLRKLEHLGEDSSKALSFTKKATMAASFATAAAFLGKYGSKILVRILKRR